VKLISTLVVFACAALLAQTPERERTEALARRATVRLLELHQEADRLAAEARTLLGDLRRLEVARQIKAEELRGVAAEATAATEALARIDTDIQRLEQQEQAELPALRARVVELYKMGDGGYVRLLLSTSDARHLAQASRMAAALAKRDRDRIAGHQRRRAEIVTARSAAQARTTRLRALRAEAERAEAAATRAVEDRNTLLEEIDRRRDLTARLAGELQSAQQDLQATLNNLADGRPTEAPAALPLGPFRGDLLWPVSGQVRVGFGARRPAAGAALTNGIEIGAAEGSAVQAIHDGAVAFAGTFAGYGKLVIVHHGAQNFSLYGQLLDLAVAREARVERGQTLGTTGVSLTGSAGLYFELRVDGRPVDPLQWLEPR